MSFIYNYLHFKYSFCNQPLSFSQLENVSKLLNNNHTVNVNKRNENKNKIKLRHIQIDQLLHIFFFQTIHHTFTQKLFISHITYLLQVNAAAVNSYNLYLIYYYYHYYYYYYYCFYYIITIIINFGSKMLLPLHQNPLALISGRASTHTFSPTDYSSPARGVISALFSHRLWLPVTFQRYCHVIRYAWESQALLFCTIAHAGLYKLLNNHSDLEVVLVEVHIVDRLHPRILLLIMKIQVV